MPEELLRSAIPVARSSRRWCMLPVSVAVHGAAAVAWFVIPLAAAGDMPIPAPPSRIVAYIKAIPLPPPPAVHSPRTAASLESRARPAPIVAPSLIAPERPMASSDIPELPIEGALPAGTGIEGALPLPGPPPPPPAESPRQPVRAGVGVREPRKIVDVAPVYPRIAVEARIEGVVVLEAVIDTNGRIDRLRVLRSAPMLDEAAIAAVKEWRYTPTHLNGMPVPVLITITVNFRLH